MQVASSQAFYGEQGKFVQPMTPSQYVMQPQACIPQPTGVTWVQQYVNGTPVLVPVYAVPPPPAMQYYQAPVYYSNNNSDNTTTDHFQPEPYRHQVNYDPYQQCSNDPGQHNTPTQKATNNERTPSNKRPSVSSVFSGSSFLPSLDENTPITFHRSSSISTPFRPSKREIFRYESTDSGIAESPPSVTSPTWSGDETSSLDDSDDARRTSDSDSYKDGEDEAGYWSLIDDQQYWGRQGQKPPNPYVCAAIAKQVDYYLSDEYLVKDKYLLRQIRCKKDGYVSIKLITSFKKVKKLTRDWQVVRSAITRNSQSIAVSPEGLRIRRHAKLSDNLRKPRLLTSVLVIRLPDEYNSVQKVTGLFRNFGEISFVRLLRADKEVPADLRNYATQVHDIGLTLCGVVDFECSEDALNAVRVIKHFQKQTDLPFNERKDQDDNADSDATIEEKYKDILKGLPPLGDLRLALLGPRVRRTLYRQDRAPESPETCIQKSDPSVESCREYNSVKRKERKEGVSEPLMRLSSVDDTTATRGSLSIISGPRRNQDVTKESCSRSLPKNFGASCSWVAQRRSVALSTGSISSHSLVTRSPKGPDGTAGFKLVRKL